jgi:hypothetical protein
MERWIEEAFALAVKGYVGNWKLQRDVLNMIPVVVCTLYIIFLISPSVSDSTNALSKAINRCESSNPFRRRRDLPSYQERMLGRDEYLRMQAIAKEIDRERREREENSL